MSTPKFPPPADHPPQTTPAAPPAFQLALRLPVTVPGQLWTARLEGLTPEGHPLRSREFQNLGDLTTFLGELATARGLR